LLLIKMEEVQPRNKEPDPADLLWKLDPA
jgi:hypothetical protein